mmetsp:Transcript_26651/g.89227  ORF Transcript_26651/g.89227 Transcript_26651/m.89227 type:complete len:233 (+) Transcript_26651:1315-2013(+)
MSKRRFALSRELTSTASATGESATEDTSPRHFPESVLMQRPLRTSQMRTLASLDPLITRFPASLKAAEVTAPRCPASVHWSRPPAERSCTWSSRSWPPETRRPPAAATAAVYTGAPGPSRTTCRQATASCPTWKRSASRTESPSMEREAWPSGGAASAPRAPWASEGPSPSAVATQTRTVPSAEALATTCPAAEACTAHTRPRWPARTAGGPSCPASRSHSLTEWSEDAETR